MHIGVQTGASSQTRRGQRSTGIKRNDFNLLKQFRENAPPPSGLFGLNRSDFDFVHNDGRNCNLYQGVTLGALSLPRDADGHIIRGKKRHPTVESGSTLYANATVLGGQTVVGADSVIGGSVFLTRSVPPRSRVSLKEPELRVGTRDGAAEPDAIYFDI